MALGILRAGVGLGSLLGSMFGGRMVNITQGKLWEQSPISAFGALITGTALYVALTSNDEVLVVFGWI